MRHLLKITLGQISLLVFFFLFSSPSLAACDLTGLGFCNDLGVSEAVSRVLSIAIGVAGGVAFLLLIYGGFRLISSQGDPKALQDARGIITSAISGLLFIIFSVFILKLIGVSILGLPI
jgi:hypothetical protein